MVSFIGNFDNNSNKNNPLPISMQKFGVMPVLYSKSDRLSYNSLYKNVKREGGRVKTLDYEKNDK
jgi:hypothetical protein